MSFYSQPPQLYNSPTDPLKRSTPSPYIYEPSRIPRPISLAGKNIFSNLGSNSSSNKRLISNNNLDSPRYYKTKPKNKIIDPISGEIKIFNIDRPKIANLDISSQKDKLTNELDYESIKKFHQQKGLLKSLDSIAGSLKKEVPFVPYVDPFILKTSLANS